MLMRMLILCPKCKSNLDDKFRCSNGHQFSVIKNKIIDLLISDYSDSERIHWEDAESHHANLPPNKYFSSKIHESVYSVVSIFFSKYFSVDHVKVLDIGCGAGSGLNYLKISNFKNIVYCGVDISVNQLMKAEPKKNWNVVLIRGDANDLSFLPDDEFDIIFTSSALHHLNVKNLALHIKRMLKPNGYYFLREPSSSNIFAIIGRKFVKGYHTESETQLDPNKLKNHFGGMELVYEKGFRFLTGSMQYLLGKFNITEQKSKLFYQICEKFDRLTHSPKYSYDFIQIYRKS